jgi:hypothetical protein
VKQEILLGFVPVPKRRPSQAYADWKEERKKKDSPEPEQMPYPSILELLQNPSYPSPNDSEKGSPHGKGDGWKGATGKKGEGKTGDGKKGQKGFEAYDEKGKERPFKDDGMDEGQPKRQVPGPSEIAACVESLLDSAYASPLQEALADKVINELEIIVRCHRDKQMTLNSFLPTEHPPMGLASMPMRIPMPPHFGPVGYDSDPTHFGSGERRNQRLNWM